MGKICAEISKIYAEIKGILPLRIAKTGSISILVVNLPYMCGDKQIMCGDKQNICGDKGNPSVENRQKGRFSELVQYKCDVDETVPRSCRRRKEGLFP